MRRGLGGVKRCPLAGLASRKKRPALDAGRFFWIVHYSDRAGFGLVSLIVKGQAVGFAKPVEE